MERGRNEEEDGRWSGDVRRDDNKEMRCKR